jgi:hypothetical protein
MAGNFSSNRVKVLSRTASMSEDSSTTGQPPVRRGQTSRPHVEPKTMDFPAISRPRYVGSCTQKSIHLGSTYGVIT